MLKRQDPPIDANEIEPLVRRIYGLYKRGLVDVRAAGITLSDYAPGSVRMGSDSPVAVHYLRKLTAQAREYMTLCSASNDIHLALDRAFDVFFTSPEMAELDDVTSFAAAFELARTVSGATDPYHNHKAAQNRFWCAVADRISDTLCGCRTTLEVKRSIISILRVAALANSDDVGNENRAECTDHLTRFFSGEPWAWPEAILQYEACCDADQFFGAVSVPGPILYFLDNAGEVQIDLLCINMLLDIGFIVYVIAREGPVFNDVTQRELADHLSERPSLGNFLIDRLLIPLAISGGTLDLRMMGSDLVTAWRRAVADGGGVIAKGSANAKALWQKRLTLPSLLCLNITKSRFMQSALAPRGCVASTPLTYALVYQERGE